MIERLINLGIVNAFGGGGGYAPPPVATPTVPATDNAAVQEAMEKERDLARKRKGRSSTILTSGLGLEDAGTKKTLLGS